MAGLGRAPKPAHLRQRRNKVSTRATLPSEADSARNEVPDLPARESGWHPLVMEWWTAVWRSPMAAEFLSADMTGGLYELAELRQDFRDATSPSQRGLLAAEIRRQDARFGLDTISRRRLQWEVERGEQAAERTSTRRERKKATAKPGEDPRTRLKLA